MVTTTKWGRTASGRSPWPGAVAIGVSVSAILAVTVGVVGGGERPWLLGLLVLAFTLPTTVALGWVLRVDRSTVAGATPRPEQSVESAWYDAAARGAFHDLIVLGGLGSAAFAIVPAWRGVSASAVLVALVVFAAADVAVRYRLAARRA